MVANYGGVDVEKIYKRVRIFGWPCSLNKKHTHSTHTVQRCVRYALCAWKLQAVPQLTGVWFYHSYNHYITTATTGLVLG